MSIRIAPYSGVNWGTFSVDATTALTPKSAAASGVNITAAEAGGVKVTRMLVSCPSADLRYTTSGAVPTAATWFKLVAGDVLEVDVDPSKFSFIGAVAGPSTVYVEYHGS